MFNSFPDLFRQLIYMRACQSELKDIPELKEMSELKDIPELKETE